MSPYYHIDIIEADGNTIRINLKVRQLTMLHDVLAKWNDNMGINIIESVNYDNGAYVVLSECQGVHDGLPRR